MTKLPRQAGQKEARFTHLLSGEVNIEQLAEEQPARKATVRTNDSDRVANLEEQVQLLTAQVESLTRQFEEFKKQFE